MGYRHAAGSGDKETLYRGGEAERGQRLIRSVGRVGKALVFSPRRIVGFRQCSAL
jgi:hypothetical protein